MRQMINSFLSIATTDLKNVSTIVNSDDFDHQINIPFDKY